MTALLLDAILMHLADGKRTTEDELALLVGEDKKRVLHELRALASKGAVARTMIFPVGRLPYEVFIPDVGMVQELIRGRRGAVKAADRQGRNPGRFFG